MSNHRYQPQPQQSAHAAFNNILSTVVLIGALCIFGFVGYSFVMTPPTPATVEQAQPTAAPRPQAQPTPVVIYQPAPVIYRQEPSQPEPVIAPVQPPPAPASAGPEAPAVPPPPAVDVQERSMVIVIRTDGQGGQIVTGPGACRVKTGVVARCGK